MGRAWSCVERIGKGVVLAALAACGAVPGPGPSRAVGDSCPDPSGRAAWDEARACLAAGRDAEAAQAARRVLERCPEHVRAHLAYQDVALRLGGDVERAMREFYESPPIALRRVAETSPIWPWARARLAPHEAGRQEFLEEALRRDPRFAWALLDRGRMMRRLGRPARALVSLRAAVGARPDLPEARLELAEVLVELGSYREADRHYTVYRRLRPTDRWAARDHARLLIYRLGDTRAARPVVERLLREDPEDPAAVMDLAAIHWREERFEEALAAYRSVLRRDPRAARAAMNIANLYYEPLARGGEARRRAAWTKARRAYRYVRRLGVAADFYDAFDLLFTVPFRLERIEGLLGPDREPEPGPEDF